jgi:hypothetical protein
MSSEVCGRCGTSRPYLGFTFINNMSFCCERGRPGYDECGFYLCVCCANVVTSGLRKLKKSSRGSHSRRVKKPCQPTTDPSVMCTFGEREKCRPGSKNYCTPCCVRYETIIDGIVSERGASRPRSKEDEKSIGWKYQPSVSRLRRNRHLDRMIGAALR